MSLQAANPSQSNSPRGLMASTIMGFADGGCADERRVEGLRRRIARARARIGTGEGSTSSTTGITGAIETSAILLST
jgi:hypothetical protein